MPSSHGASSKWSTWSLSETRLYSPLHHAHLLVNLLVSSTLSRALSVQRDTTVQSPPPNHSTSGKPMPVPSATLSMSLVLTSTHSSTPMSRLAELASSPRVNSRLPLLSAQARMLTTLRPDGQAVLIVATARLVLVPPSKPPLSAASCPRLEVNLSCSLSVTINGRSQESSDVSSAGVPFNTTKCHPTNLSTSRKDDIQTCRHIFAHTTISAGTLRYTIFLPRSTLQ